MNLDDTVGSSFVDITKAPMTNILLVEDNLDMQTLLRDLLEWGGHQVMLGRTGQEGLEALQTAQLPPDLIISDLTMPYMDGLELFQAVRQNPKWAHIRFIIMSANPQDERLKSRQAGDLNGVLPKPFSLEELNRLLS
jgi:two-component system chemotaxis response regulator CheY